MNVVVITAHPGDSGHNKVLADKVKSLLASEKSSKITYLDLYKDGFDPVLPKSEHYTGGKPKLDSVIVRHQKLVSEADAFVFIYPVWWGSMPAILKGWFDRVFTSPFAFKYEPLGFKIFGLEARPVPKLKGKRAVVLMTMGSPAVVDYALLQFPAFLIQRMILGFCGIKSRVFVAHRCLGCDEKKILSLERMASRAIQWLVK